MVLAYISGEELYLRESKLLTKSVLLFLEYKLGAEANLTIGLFRAARFIATERASAFLPGTFSKASALEFDP